MAESWAQKISFETPWADSVDKLFRAARVSAGAAPFCVYPSMRTRPILQRPT
jgi:hypothetical protein